MSELKIEIKIIPNTKENIKECERIRYDSLGHTIPDEYLTSSNASARLNDADLMIFALYLDDLLAAACYVGDSFDSLFVDQLFVKKEFQETGLYLGRTLLKFILDNKDQVESYFHFRASKSMLFYLDEKSRKIYEKFGYQIKNENICLMEKKLTIN